MIIALTMWLVAIILGVSDFKTESTRWAMGLAFFAGLAGFPIFWEDSAIPFFGATNEFFEVIEVVLLSTTIV